jgi:Glycosyltransferase family 87
MDSGAAGHGSQQRDSRIGIALALVAGVLALVFFQRSALFLANGWSDLRLYLGAARILVGGRPDLLYDWAEQQRQQADWAGAASPYVNPPFLALFFIPLLHLSRPAALTLTAAGETAAVVAAMACAARIARLRQWWPLAVAALAHPVMLQIWLSVQPAPLATLAWAGFALCWVRGRRDLAAAWLLLGIAVKPHLMLLLVVLLLFTFDLRALSVLVAGCLLLALGAWALIGGGGLARYPAILQPVATSGHWAVNAAAMPNVRGLLAALFGDRAFTRVAATICAVVVGAGVAWAARWPQKTEAERARVAFVALAGTMLASFHMHVQELTGLFLLLALAVAAGWLPRARLIPLAAAITGLLWVFDLTAQLTESSFPGRHVWSLVPLAMAAVYAGALRRARRLSPGEVAAP